jgi:hypothetical protein
LAEAKAAPDTYRGLAPRGKCSPDIYFSLGPANWAFISSKTGCKNRYFIENIEQD